MLLRSRNLTVGDRLIFVWPNRLFPSVLSAISVVEPETVVRWHRMGFRLYWRWKSRSCGGRPRIPAEIRHLIRGMSLVNRLWGAPRIHGELLKLGIEVAAQSTVAKYMAKCGRGRSQWKTFLRNHATGIGAMDFLIVPTIGFKLLFNLVILRHERRHRLLQRTPNASVLGQGFSDPSAYSTARSACRAAHPLRTSSSILSDIVSGRHNGNR